MDISFCLPVFNVENYLEESISSIIKLTYDLQGTSRVSYEILCVDDGSTDRSLEVLAQLSAKHNQIRIIHQGNMGVSSARNVLIDNAKGEYIWFVDPDDILISEAVIPFLEAASSNDADMILGDYLRFSDGEKNRADEIPPNWGGTDGYTIINITFQRMITKLLCVLFGEAYLDGIFYSKTTCDFARV